MFHEHICLKETHEKYEAIYKVDIDEPGVFEEAELHFYLKFSF